MSTMHSFTYSFIILCYNNWSLTKQTLETLVKSLHSITEAIEIIIVDNGSEDETCVQVKSFLGITSGISVHYERLKMNMGYPFGINFGLYKACGEFVTVLNNDLVLIEGWFEPIVKVLRGNKDIGVGVPHLYSTVGCNSKGDVNRNLDNGLQYTDRAIGACMTIKREVLEKVGGNDLWFGAGHYDDDDWCLRIRIAGFKIAVVNSFIYHVGSATFKQSKYEQRNFVISNREKFLRKWKMKSSNDDRSLIIRDTMFSPSEHYIPFAMPEELQKTELYTKEKTESVTKQSQNSNTSNALLFVADWNNRDSKWRERLVECVNDSIKQRQEIYLWIPDKYFDSEKIFKCIPKYVSNKDYIHLICDNVCPKQFGAFLSQFNLVIKIQDDFVNRVILLIKQSLD